MADQAADQQRKRRQRDKSADEAAGSKCQEVKTGKRPECSRGHPRRPSRPFLSSRVHESFGGWTNELCGRIWIRNAKVNATKVF